MGRLRFALPDPISERLGQSICDFRLIRHLKVSVAVIQALYAYVTVRLVTGRVGDS